MPTLAPRFASMSLAVAGGVHAAAAAEHDRSPATLAFFVVVAMAQTAGAFALALKPSRALRAVVVTTSLGLLVLWAASRTVGVSIGHEGREPAGALDSLAVAAQLITVLAIGWAWGSVPHRLGRAFAAAALPVAIAVASAGLLLPTHAHDHPAATDVPSVVRGTDAPASSVVPTLEPAGVVATPPSGRTTGHAHVDEPGAAPHPHP